MPKRLVIRRPRFNPWLKLRFLSLSCIHVLNGALYITPSRNSDNSLTMLSIFLNSSDVVGGKDEPDAPALSLEEALRQLGLETLTEAFHKEQVDYDSLVSIK